MAAHDKDYLLIDNPWEYVPEELLREAVSLGHAELENPTTDGEQRYRDIMEKIELIQFVAEWKAQLEANRFPEVKHELKRKAIWAFGRFIEMPEDERFERRVKELLAHIYYAVEGEESPSLEVRRKTSKTRYRRFRNQEDVQSA